NFQVQAATTNSDAGLGGDVVTATITVSPVADTPGVTGATTSEDAQTSSGLVISRNAADGAEGGYFKVMAISHGTLFLADGTTQTNRGDSVRFQDAAGLRFPPPPASPGPASFDVQASLSNSDAGLGGDVVTATITVSPVADTPSVSGAVTSEDV